MKLVSMVLAIFFAAIIATTTAAGEWGFMVHLTAKEEFAEEIAQSMKDFGFYCAYGAAAKIDYNENKTKQWYGMATTQANLDKTECSETALKLIVQGKGKLVTYKIDKKFPFATCVQTTGAYEEQVLKCDVKGCSNKLPCSNAMVSSSVFAFALIVVLAFFA